MGKLLAVTNPTAQCQFGHRYWGSARHVPARRQASSQATASRSPGAQAAPTPRPACPQAARTECPHRPAHRRAPGRDTGGSTTSRASPRNEQGVPHGLTGRGPPANRNPHGSSRRGCAHRIGHLCYATQECGLSGRGRHGFPGPGSPAASGNERTLPPHHPPRRATETRRKPSTSSKDTPPTPRSSLSSCRGEPRAVSAADAGWGYPTSRPLSGVDQAGLHPGWKRFSVWRLESEMGVTKCHASVT